MWPTTCRLLLLRAGFEPDIVPIFETPSKAFMNIERPKPKIIMPPDAKLAFKGVLFDVYQWEQEMFDGSKATFERIKRPDTVIVFPVLPDGKILLTKQEQPAAPPFIAGAGGRMEDGEDPEEAARREMLEETGYEAKEFVLWDAQQPVGKIDWAVYTFIAKGVTKVADLNLDAGEKIELYPVSFDEFLEIGTKDNFAEREIVPLILQALADPKKKEDLKQMFGSN